MNAEGRPGQSAPQPNYLDTVRVTRTADKSPALAVVPTVHVVRGCRGRNRLVLVVRCPWCSELHAHTSTAAFVEGRRTASCHRGRYLLRLPIVRQRLAPGALPDVVAGAR